MPLVAENIFEKGIDLILTAVYTLIMVRERPKPQTGEPK
jgi:hypothetical protein